MRILSKSLRIFFCSILLALITFTNAFTMPVLAESLSFQYSSFDNQNNIYLANFFVRTNNPCRTRRVDDSYAEGMWRVKRINGNDEAWCRVGADNDINQQPLRQGSFGDCKIVFNSGFRLGITHREGFSGGLETICLRAD